MSVDQRVWIFKGISPKIPIFVGRTIGMGTYFQANPHGVLPKKRMGHDYTLNESIATNIGWQLLNCTCWKLLKTGCFQVQTMEPHVQRVQLIMSHVYVILVICTHTHVYYIYIYINIKNSDKSSYKISWVLFGPQNAAPWPHRRQNLWLSHPAARNRPQRRETPSTCRADLVHSSPWMVSYYLIVVHPYFLQHPSEFRYHMISLMIATRQQTQTKQTMGSCKLSQQARKSGLF